MQVQPIYKFVKYDVHKNADSQDAMKQVIGCAILPMLKLDLEGDMLKG